MTADPQEYQDEQEINAIMSKYQPSSKQNSAVLQGEEKKPEIKPGIMTKMLVSSLAGVSKIMARKTEVKAWELDSADQHDLETALAPFEDELWKLIAYIKYLPLVVFSIGYTFRIIDAMRDRKKEKADKAKADQETQKKVAQEAKDAENKLKTAKEQQNLEKPLDKAAAPSTTSTEAK